MLIGICGSGDRCGKSTFAEQLHHLIDSNYYMPFSYIKQFSEPIKQLVQDYYGFEFREDLEANKDEYQSDGYRPRDWFRMLYQEPEKMNPDFWYNQLLNNYDPECDVFLITDLRDSHKAARIKEMGGIIIFINGTGHNIDTIFGLVPDYTVDNSNYDLDVMEQQVKAVLNDLIKRNLLN